MSMLIDNKVPQNNEHNILTEWSKRIRIIESIIRLDRG
jgi:hypothetical protein